MVRCLMRNIECLCVFNGIFDKNMLSCDFRANSDKLRTNKIHSQIHKNC